MSLEMLLEQFDRVLRTPADIEKLTRSILQWAVMGRLVPQNPNDVPAEALLERIGHQRESLAKAGKLRNTPRLSAVDPNEIPFLPPDGWSWCRVGQVCTIRGGKRVPKGYRLLDDPTDYIYIRVTDMKNGTIEDNGLKYISSEIREEIARYVIEKDDLYITIAGTIGAVGEVPTKFHGMNLTENAARITPHLVDKGYLKLALSSPAVQSQFADKVNQMAQPKLALTRIRTTLLPLPPLAEQGRIALEVDVLFEQTQELAGRLESADAQRRKFHAAAIHRLTEAKTPKETGAAWHLIRDNFDRLYTEPETIDELKQAILQLAVMGRLVPQDRNDEPAEVLLERIAAEKKRLWEAGNIRRQKKLLPISREYMPYELPFGWSWAYVNTVSKYIVDCPHSTAKFIGEGEFYCIDTTNINQGEILYEKLRRVSEDTFLERIRRLKPEPGDILFSREGTIGLSVIVPKGIELCLGQRMMLYRTHRWVGPEYFRLVLISPMFVAQWRASLKGTAARHVNIGALIQMLIPVPPLEEQQRIVAKVDEVSEQARTLVERLDSAEETRGRLLNAVLDKAVS